MKKILLITLLLFTQLSFAQTCIVGNNNETGFSDVGDPIYMDYLLGVRFTVPTAGTLTSLNLIGRNTGSQVQMAVYKDNAGVPGDLLAKSSTGTVGEGVVTLSVPATAIPAGNYWVMAVYDENGGHTYSKSEIDNKVYFKSLNSGSDIPVNASDFESYTGTNFTYYMTINCGPVSGINNVTMNTISFFPNPSKDIVMVSGVETLSDLSFVITDLSGHKIFSGVLGESYSIDMNSLERGIYIVQLGSSYNQMFKLVKE